MIFKAYHVHVYCTSQEFEFCKSLRERLLRDLQGVIAGAGPVRDRPVGPHPIPMFEAWFSGDHLDKVKNWMSSHRGDLSVLFHPLSGNEIDDHTKYAVWMGPALDLDLSVLRN